MDGILGLLLKGKFSWYFGLLIIRLIIFTKILSTISWIIDMLNLLTNFKALTEVLKLKLILNESYRWKKIQSVELQSFWNTTDQKMSNRNSWIKYKYRLKIEKSYQILLELLWNFLKFLIQCSLFFFFIIFER